MAYSGTSITIPLGELGVLSDRSPTELPPSSLLTANNISLFNGSAEKAPGTIHYNQNAFPAGVVAVFDYWPVPAKQRMIAATADGKLYRDEIGGGFNGNTPIRTGLGSLTPNCMFVEGGKETGGRDKKLFFFSAGASKVQVLTADESTFRDILLPSVDWVSGSYPKQGLIHQNRLWAFAGQMSYASDSGDHENFQTNYLAEPMSPGEGGEIRGAFVFKGRMFAWKEGGFVYYLDDTSADETDWLWRKVGSSASLSAPNAACEVINDMWFGNATGAVTSMTASFNLGSVDAADIFKQLECAKFVRDHTNASGLTEQHALYYPEKKQTFFTHRSTYRPTNDMLICIDANRPNGRLTFWKKGSPQCLALRKDVNEIHRPIYGDAAGFIHLMDRETRLEGSTAYEGSFQTPHIDFRFADPALANRTKLFSYLAVTYGPESTGNLSCDYFIDGKYIDTVIFPMVQYLSPELDTFLLSTDRLAYGGQETAMRKLAGFGRTISFKFYNSGANESFRITSLTVGFKPAGQQAQKATGG